MWTAGTDAISSLSAAFSAVLLAHADATIRVNYGLLGISWRFESFAEFAASSVAERQLGFYMPHVDPET
ncbi:hypothetical protein KR51_00013670 [Rubidibacter lacunae KORDI 51-2]|uniref:Uncharacterized protein n=1 Tax=Rubidibacter lacunae KORDI 51-2 TaxID=582515 RepID=U5DME0_9CHRO|nr:hypothetical protein [Rubidibacter lacunae]ERN42032.1 hypothetical protein KR51_00013670 [Rubidibacter lacunae KORDI 51-2]